jgi:GalNAc-alpha-(1->4)-GalNAc-alpha-(1->3)-diNAcBac-PP-undecaprenol alpha-1,4-N-acetyl-D-galactosaminyltransferase
MAGPSDLIDDGINGFLVPEGNEILFQIKLTELMENEELRKQFGLAAKKKMQFFNESQIALEYFNFITSIGS